MKLTAAAKGLYRSENGRYYVRPLVNGKRTTRKLRSRDLDAALVEMDEEAQAIVRFDALVERWLEEKCPGTDRAPRSDEFCIRARHIMKWPTEYFGAKDVGSIKPSELAGYGAWRASKVIKPGSPGTRAADLELSTCASMCWWAYFSDIVKANPFAIKFTFHKAAAISHSPDRAPATADMVHAIGGYLTNRQRASSCGFLWLFLCLTGCRTKELRLLRLDGLPEGQKLPVGWHSDTEIVIARGKRKDAARDILKLSPPAQELLKAWRNWHAAKCAGSPWWFPGTNLSVPLNSGSLCRAVKGAAVALGFAPTLSPHGARSFYCSVLRTVEPDDRRVADALGHTNVSMVQTIYGKRASNIDGLTWLPSSGQPGWARWANVDDRAPMAPIRI